MTEETPDTNPYVKPEMPALEEPSIVDTILDLDELLSADVRRAEKTARFSIQPWLEADIDELEAELGSITDDRGMPIDGGDASLGEASRAQQLAHQIRTLRGDYAASMRSVRVQQLPGDKWREFEVKWADALEAGSPYPNEMWDELIAACAVRPAMTLEQVQKLRTQLGHPQLNQIAMACWRVNTNAGVSVPKSLLSSRVLKLEQLERS